MNLFNPNFKLFALFCVLGEILLSAIVCSCNNPESFENESAIIYEIFEGIKPNDSFCASKHFYGKNNIEGNSIIYRLSTSNTDVYVDFNITLLELHPCITVNLLSFIDKHMSIAKSDTVVPCLLRELAKTEYPQHEIARKVLDRESDLFYDVADYLLSQNDNTYYFEFDMQPVFMNDDYVTYKFVMFTHTLYDVCEFRTFNINTGEQLSIEDIVVNEVNDILRQKVVEYFSDYYGITVSKFFDTINSGLDIYNMKNFPISTPSLHESGLVFTYECGRFTPGTRGPITILLAYDDIRDCLKYPFKDYITTYSPHAVCRQTDNIERGCRYSEQEKDSIRKTMGLTDTGKPFPINIYDEYIYRHGNPTCEYSESQLYGTWIVHGHKYDHRKILTLKPNGYFIAITEEPAHEDSCGNMLYNLASTTMGKYCYDQTYNKLTFKNQHREFEIPTKNFIIYDHPEHEQIIVHSIVGDTMIIADEKGDCWPCYRSKSRSQTEH